MAYKEQYGVLRTVCGVSLLNGPQERRVAECECVAVVWVKTNTSEMRTYHGPVCAYAVSRTVSETYTHTHLYMHTSSIGMYMK